MGALMTFYEVIMFQTVDELIAFDNPDAL